MNFSNAIVRKPGINFSKGITITNLGKPDIKLALKQHEEYCLALEKCGLAVELELLNLDLVTINMSEFRKMDGGISCLSLRF